MQTDAPRRRSDGSLLRDASISFVALVLVFAAFDDITTDNATHFTVEYIALSAAAAWFAFVAVRLIRTGRRMLGTLSLAALAAALWAQRGIGPGITPGFWPEYIVMTAVFVWFLVLAATLAVLGGRGVLRPVKSDV